MKCLHLYSVYCLGCLGGRGGAAGSFREAGLGGRPGGLSAPLRDG